MSIYLRIILIISSLGTFWYIARKLKKSQVQIPDSIFWILSAALILFMSLFPDVVCRITYMIGIESPVNGIFLVIIFILLIKSFFLSIKISQLEYKIKRLVEEIGVRNSKSETNIPK